MREREFCGFLNIAFQHFAASAHCRNGFARLEHDYVAAMAVTARFQGLPGNRVQYAVVRRYFGVKFYCRGYFFRDFFRLRAPAFRETVGVFLVYDPPFYYFNPLLLFAQSFDLNAQAKAVEQLRPEFALFRIHGSHQRKPRLVRKADALRRRLSGRHGCRKPRRRQGNGQNVLGR